MEDKGTMNVKIFVWLMLHNKMLMQDVLIYRGSTVATGCHLCAANLVETKNHNIMGMLLCRTILEGADGAVQHLASRGRKHTVRLAKDWQGPYSTTEVLVEYGLGGGRLGIVEGEEQKTVLK